jgi:hypothetical protein
VNGVDVRFVKFSMGDHDKNAMAEGGSGGMNVGAELEISSKGEKETITPYMTYNGGKPVPGKPGTSVILGGQVIITDMHIGMTGGESAIAIEFVRGGQQAGAAESLIVEASIKPGMNLLWAGSVLLFLGLIVSMMYRKRETL